MNVIEKNGDQTTVQLGIDELGLLLEVLTEFTSGPNAPSNEDWDMLMNYSVEDVLGMRESISRILTAS